MNPSGLRSTGPRSPLSSQRQLQSVQRSDSSSSDSSVSSQVTTLSVSQQAAQNNNQSQNSRTAHGATYHGGNSLQNFSRPTPHTVHSDQGVRNWSPQFGQGASHHTQGFFEPSLPSTSNLTASQIAAQAAMHHQAQQHARKRSQTSPSPNSPTEPSAITGRRKPNSTATPAAHLTVTSGSASQTGGSYQNGLPGGSSAAAATAASAAFPRLSPGFSANDPPILERDVKPKPEKSKMKLFSKPKSIGIIKDKDLDRKDKPLQSPNKLGTYGPNPLPRLVSASTTSLADSVASASSAFYQSANSSTATLTPITEKATNMEKEKQPKHHFLSRQKNKLKDREDHHHLPLSSAASNSKPLDPSAPQSLYSFIPSSPGPTSTSFSKSVSGLDLRHAGRALREKKREEKANAASMMLESASREHDQFFPGSNEWTGPPSASGLSTYGSGAASGYSTYGSAASIYGDNSSVNGLAGFGLSGMTPDDAWPFLKAKILIIFEGEDLRLPIEDFNRLVIAHTQRCIKMRAPHILIEDIRELLHTGFSSLDQTLRRVPDERLIPYLVDMWLVTFRNILPYMQAVFLPLDLEFKGTGSIMQPQEAKEFWGGLPDAEKTIHPLADTLDVRHIVLTSYRDVIIIPRHDVLKTTFSRLSLELINGTLPAPPEIPSSSLESNGRPSTAASLDPGLASSFSQSSTLLNDSIHSLNSSSAAMLASGRSRAISNVSSNTTSSHAETLFTLNPYNTPLPAQQQTAKDSARVADTVGRILQCISVLASVQTADEAQTKMEVLAKTLKLNWLGRGRTGRNRRGLVGARITKQSSIQTVSG